MYSLSCDDTAEILFLTIGKTHWIPSKNILDSLVIEHAIFLKRSKL